MIKNDKLNFFSTAICLILLLSRDIASCQQIDAGFWSTFSFEKGITKRFSLHFKEELRVKENWTQPDMIYSEVGASYKPAKGFKLSLSYRFFDKYNPAKYYLWGFRFGHRFMFDLSYRYKVRSWNYVYRSRVSTEMKYIYSSDKGKVPDWFWRNKVEVRYVLNRFEPYVGAELWYQFRDPRNPESDFGFHRIRVFAGSDFAVARYHTIGLYCLLQQEWLVNDPKDLFILGVEYSITLPYVKKKKQGK